MSQQRPPFLADGHGPISPSGVATALPEGVLLAADLPSRLPPSAGVRVTVSSPFRW